MKPIATLLLAASLWHLNAQSHKPSSTNIPPRLFSNGEVARTKDDKKKVVVLSASWDRKERCWVYVVVPK